MDTVHITCGRLGRSVRFPPGQVVAMEDDLSDGILHRDRCLNQRLRCAYRCEPVRDLDRAEEAVSALALADEVVIWHGPTPAEQLMLTWLAPWLAAGDVTPAAVRLACAADDEDQPLPLTRAASQEVLRGYMARRGLDAKTGDLLHRLWDAVTADNPAALQTVTDAELRALPLWLNARSALLGRYPDATGLSFHDRVILAQCAARWRSAKKIVAVTVEESALAAPLSSRMAWRRIRRLAAQDGEGDPLLEVRCTGALVPEACELRLTDLGVQGAEGSIDVLTHLPLCEWIGGVLLQSPDRIWRWTDFGLVRDEV